MIIRRLVLSASLGIVLVGLLLNPMEALAQPHRLWLDVGGAVVQPERQSFAVESAIRFRELPTITIEYPDPQNLVGINFGAGFLVNSRFGLGVSMDWASQDEPAQLTMRSALTAFPPNAVIATAPTERALLVGETGIHLQLVFVAWDSGRARLRLFGGPSRFNYAQDAAFAVLTTPTDPTSGRNDVTILESRITRIDGGGWGVHAGADATYFFLPRVGIALDGRWSTGTVDVAEPFADRTEERTVGGIQVGAGVRFRF